MSGIRSRSTAAANVVEFRHPAFFEELDDWQEQSAAHAEYLAERKAWENKPEATRGPEPKAVPEPDVLQYKDTEFDSVWRFRRHKLNGDAEQILWRVTSSSIDWREMARQYTESEGRVVPQITDTMRTTTQRAELVQMSVDVAGPFFQIPDNFTVGDFEGTDDDHVHPLAGQLMPIEPAWLNVLDEAVLDAASAFLKDVYARRTPAQQATFRKSAVPMADESRAARRRRARGAE